MQIADTYRKVWRILDTRSRRLFLLASPLPILGSLIELATAILIFNLIMFVVGSTEHTPSTEVFERFTWLGWIRDQGVVFAISTVAGAAVLKAVYRLIHLYLFSFVIERSIRIAKARLFKTYLAAPLLYHTSANRAGLIRNLWTQVEHTIRIAATTAQSFLTQAFTISALIIPIVLVSPKSLLAVLSAIALASGIALAFARKYQLKWGRAWHHVIAQMLALVEQAFAGIREIKIYQRETYFTSAYEQHESRYERLRRWRQLIDTAPGIVLEAGLIIGLCVVLIWLNKSGVNLISMGPVLGLIAYVSLRILPLSNQLIAAVSQIRRQAAAADSIYTDFTNLQSDSDFISLESGAGSRKGAQIADPQEISEIRLEDLTFVYPSERQAGVRDISLTIQGGASVAIIGATGCGKTTLLNLILGFIAPQQGRVMVDGVDISKDVSYWFPNIGYVQQEPFMLDGSVRENIAFAIDKDEVDAERLSMATTASQLDEWIQSLPGGLDTKVGENGVRISGGQRQRIAIARALYRRPTVLIMDEPTSAIDSQTERALEHAILGIQDTVTRIIVTHRLDTARLCDQVIFLAGGRISAVGSFDSLMHSNPAFRLFADASVVASENPGDDAS